MKLEFRSEVHCDECGEIVHNHFHCPACGNEDAGTSIYMAVWEKITKIGDEFTCESCGAIFILVSKEADDFYEDWEWEIKSTSESPEPNA